MKVTITVDTTVKSEIEEAISLLSSIIGDKKPVRAQKSTKSKPEGKDEGEDKKPVKNPSTEENGISLNDLKERAKQKANEVGRDKVKACISEFADRLTEVDESDYGRLYKKLGELL